MSETPEQALAQSHSAEVVNAAMNHAEALEKSRKAQADESEQRIAELVGNHIKEAIEHAFFVPAEPGKQKKFIDITQIPRICDDITTIKNTLWWQSRIAGVLGTIALTLIAAMISK